MGSRTPPNKVLQDIEDCVFELKRESIDGKTPINDDSAELHRFQEKLELILLLGLLEKPGLLGSRKSYWSYICACFTSSKRSHDGINFVKTIVLLKTSRGRGRAFIRFCLTQKCLADTLQSCFMNHKISRDFYAERSLPVQEKLWSTLVASLYELNEVNFDFCPGHTELDISWPKFARKLFISSETQNFPNKNLSSTSLHSFSSQDEHDSIKWSDSDSLSALDVCASSNRFMENVDGPKLIELNDKLSVENQSLQEEVKYLEREKLRLQTDIQNLQVEFQTLYQMKSSDRENLNMPLSSQMHLENDVSTSSSFPVTEVNVNYNETAGNASRCSEKGQSSLERISVKPKVKSEVGNYSECALQQSDNEMLASQICDSSDTCKKNVANLHVKRNVYLPQNTVHISELLLEFKAVINDIEDIVQKSEITLAVPHISRLKRIKNSLEGKLSNEFDKSKNLNLNHFVENFVSCLKNFSSKQNTIIDSLQEKIDLSVHGNQNLYSRLTVLKDLLRSYGFLKSSNGKEIESKGFLFPLDAASDSPKSCEILSCDNLAHDPVLKRIIVPLLPILNSTFTKLSTLNEKIIELQFGMDSSQELNNYLINRVQDQEIHLKGVTKELEEAQHLVSVLKTQHRKLQSAGGILKYDLQEKRKLLTRLKQQLESTREDFNLVRIKNSKSEAEWQDLRKEFVQRHKQTSEESGFVDDKGFEEYESVFPSSTCDYNLSDVGTSENVTLNNSTEAANQEVPIKKSRLELLEEQCQHLHSSLLHSSKKRQDIDRRLDTMCKTIEKSNSGIIHSSTYSNDIPSGSNPKSNDTQIHISSEENVIFSSDNFVNSPHSSSDVGSLNSECSSCIPIICNDNISTDSCYCESSKADSCISVSPFNLQIDGIQNLSFIEQINEKSLLDSDATSCNSEFKDGDEVRILSSESVGLTVNNLESSESQNVSLSQVDSLLIKKKDLEESLKNLQITDEFAADNNRFMDSEEFIKKISALEEEKTYLLKKIQELEKKALLLSNELDHKTQQLILSKAAKEHEVAALQFQLNTEALKYERALKEFSEESKSLESMKQRVTEQEELILALEEALTEIRVDRENEKEQQWQELEEIQIALEVREQECITLCEDLEKSLSDADKERDKNELLVSQLNELQTYNEKNKEVMEAELINLQNDSRELQKKLVKLLKEKDILWKKSNHLHHLQKVKIDDRWMKDSEVSSCLGCKSSFSFMLRKHHCRLCGRIFCYSCSNNWLMTASSSKKLRTCNECFMQYLEMKKDVRRGSDVPQIEDDSGDEMNIGELSFIPTSNSSFNSEVPSSITDSAISLPITQKQSAPLFASAPDLRYVIKHDESTCSTSLVEENVLEEGDDKVLPLNDVKKESELNAAEISSDDCTSVTLEDIPRTNKLKDISIDEIKASEYGLSDEFVIHSGEKADLPIFCITCPIILKWRFTSSCQTIPLTITYMNETCDNESPVFSQNEPKMQDEMELSLPGYYVFHFDNTYRITELKVQYQLLLKNALQMEESILQK